MRKIICTQVWVPPKKWHMFKCESATDKKKVFAGGFKYETDYFLFMWTPKELKIRQWKPMKMKEQPLKASENRKKTQKTNGKQ